MALLTELQRKVWVLRKQGGFGPSDVGRALGLDRRVVHSIEKQAEGKLRRALDSAGEARDYALLRPQPSAHVLTDRGIGRLARGRRVAR